ncbi:Triosephosphate isomerase [Babesia sp. Xinjiang]|uniref:Triosephosphate isomerase n=1 Tax=Babesia sp. Xinjiang TaxID=462227 RepID=UPI000A224FA3|nr:Triosephosphate isomerase [Babesia sp. Xinjiang]ORM40193.1 Triosephosphate isomerase [Babesia sp. Xinjiang]
MTNSVNAAPRPFNVVILSDPPVELEKLRSDLDAVMRFTHERQLALEQQLESGPDVATRIPIKSPTPGPPGRLSLARLSDRALTRKVFRSADDCFGLLSTGSSLETHELYEALKFLASGPSERRSALADARFADMLSQVESRLPSLNSSYMGNFALRIAAIVQSAGSGKSTNADLGRSVLSKIASTIVDTGGQLRELSQVAYATSATGVDSDAIFEYSKQKLTAEIDSATPDALNLALQTAYKRGSRDKIYYALLCEKLCELTDRFTASDVMYTLRALAKTGLLKGFLLRRLSTLIMDNLDQFSAEQLSEATYRLSQLKFLTPANYSRIFTVVEPKIESLPNHLRLQLLAAGCLSEREDRTALERLLDGLEYKNGWDLSGCIDYVYSSAYLRRYGEQLPRVLEAVSNHHPSLTRRYALLLKEAVDSFEVESAPVQFDLGARWRDALSNFENTESELTKNTPTFQEVRKILQGASNNFAESQKVGPFTVPFVDQERKLVILVEFASNMSNLTVKKRCIESLGYSVGVVRYWEWRRLKTERQELEYAFRLFDTRRKGSLSFSELKRLLSSIGINLSRRELSYLQMEEDIRGTFVLEDVLALGASFYSDTAIRERLVQAFDAHFPGQDAVSRNELEALLIKMGMICVWLSSQCAGRRLMVDPSEIEACLNVHLDGTSKRDISISSFIDMGLTPFISVSLSLVSILGLHESLCYTLMNTVPWRLSQVRNTSFLGVSRPLFYNRHAQSRFRTSTNLLDRRNKAILSSSTHLSGSSVPGDPTLVVCNWKCYPTPSVAREHIQRFAKSRKLPNVELLTAPCSVYLQDMVAAYTAAGSSCIVCSQDVSAAPLGYGPFTGDVTAGLLKDIYANVSNADDRIVVAYEPGSSVGTDRPVAAEEVNETIDWIKRNARCNLRHTRFIYGGSVDQSNAIEYIRQPHVDGIMVGRLWQRPDFLELLNRISESTD